MTIVELRHATHNQGDDATTPRRGWDVQCLTERSGHPLPAWAARYAPGLKGLAIDWNPAVVRVTGRHIRIAHGGVRAMTPKRGTIWVTGHLVGTRQPVAFVCSHRINDPMGLKRSRKVLRAGMWRRHARMDRRIIRRLLRRGYLVFYGGDINHRTASLRPLRRVLAGRYDALGFGLWRRFRVRALGRSRRRLDVRFHGVDASSGRGSDHRRFTASYSIQLDDPRSR